MAKYCINDIELVREAALDLSISDSALRWMILAIDTTESWMENFDPKVIFPELET